MIGVLGARPNMVLQRKPGSRASFELMFRHPVRETVVAVALHVTEHQLQFDLIGESGSVLGGALLPRPDIEDLTEGTAEAP